MDEWIDGWVGGWMDLWVDGRWMSVGECMNGRMDGRRDEWMGGWMSMGEWMDDKWTSVLMEGQVGGWVVDGG